MDLTIYFRMTSTLSKWRTRPTIFMPVTTPLARLLYLSDLDDGGLRSAKSLVWWIKDDLDAAAMAEAAKTLVGKHDFRLVSAKGR